MSFRINKLFAILFLAAVGGSLNLPAQQLSFSYTDGSSKGDYSRKIYSAANQNVVLINNIAFEITGSTLQPFCPPAELQEGYRPVFFGSINGYACFFVEKAPALIQGNQLFYWQSEKGKWHVSETPFKNIKSFEGSGTNLFVLGDQGDGINRLYVSKDYGANFEVLQDAVIDGTMDYWNKRGETIFVLSSGPIGHYGALGIPYLKSDTISSLPIAGLDASAYIYGVATAGDKFYILSCPTSNGIQKKKIYQFFPELGIWLAMTKPGSTVFSPEIVPSSDNEFKCGFFGTVNGKLLVQINGMDIITADTLFLLDPTTQLFSQCARSPIYKNRGTSDYGYTGNQIFNTYTNFFTYRQDLILFNEGFTAVQQSITIPQYTNNIDYYANDTYFDLDSNKQSVGNDSQFENIPADHPFVGNKTMFWKKNNLLLKIGYDIVSPNGSSDCGALAVNRSLFRYSFEEHRWKNLPAFLDTVPVNGHPDQNSCKPLFSFLEYKGKLLLCNSRKVYQLNAQNEWILFFNPNLQGRITDMDSGDSGIYVMEFGGYSVFNPSTNLTSYKRIQDISFSFDPVYRFAIINNEPLFYNSKSFYKLGSQDSTYGFYNLVKMKFPTNYGAIEKMKVLRLGDYLLVSPSHYTEVKNLYVYHPDWGEWRKQPTNLPMHLEIKSLGRNNFSGAIHLISSNGGNWSSGAFDLGTTEIKEEDVFANFNTQIQVFPNPSQDILQINSPKPVEELVIYDLFGKTVYSLKNAKTESITLNLSHLISGTYIIKLTAPEENYVTKFIKL